MTIKKIIISLFIVFFYTICLSIYAGKINGMYDNRSLIQSLDDGDIEEGDRVSSLPRIKPREYVELTDNSAILYFYSRPYLVIIYVKHGLTIRAESMHINGKKDYELYFSNKKAMQNFFHNGSPIDSDKNNSSEK